MTTPPRLTARRRLLGSAAAAALLVAWTGAAGQTGAVFPKSSLAIETRGGQRHALQVELALDARQQQQGLMWRRELAADAGMLFVYPVDQEIQMWMRNTLIPLDMLFLRADGVIHRIHERAVPRSEAIIASDGPVRAVLELNGGAARRLGLQPGDRVRHPLLGG